MSSGMVEQLVSVPVSVDAVVVSVDPVVSFGFVVVVDRSRRRSSRCRWRRRAGPPDRRRRTA
ncbi:MAG: hypothetical protein ACRD0A_16520 [Acidimicrobiales bacterium]